MVEHPVAENVVPGVRKEPEAGFHVRADRRALRSRRALALAALHFPPHLRRHFFEGYVADALFCHCDSLEYSSEWAGFNLEIVRPPIKSPKIEIYQYWHNPWPFCGPA